MHLMICHRCVLVFTECLDFLKQIIILIWDFLLLYTFAVRGIKFGDTCSFHVNTCINIEFAISKKKTNKSFSLPKVYK